MSHLRTSILATVFVSNCLAYAKAQPDLYFPTNLDKPKTIISARDSLNYRLSDDVIKALTVINAGKKAEDQIRYETFGTNQTQQEYFDSIDGRKTSGLPHLPDTPFVDVEKKNKAVHQSWFSFKPYWIEQWMQDAMEFYYEGGVGKALQFKSLFHHRSFVTKEEQALVDRLSEQADREEATSEDIDRISAEIHKIEAPSHERAENMLKTWGQSIGLSSLTTLEGLEAEGGDFEILPKNVIITSIAENEGLGAIKTWLQNTAYNGRILSLDTDWLKVNHVDEVVSVVPSNHACGFAIMTIDPLSGLEILKKMKATPAIQTMIPKDYHQTSPPGAGMLDGSPLEDLYNYLVRKDSSNAENMKSLISLQTEAANRNSAMIKKLRVSYAKLNPACQEIPVVALPTLIECSDFDGKLDSCGTMLPNPVNSVVLGRDILMADPYLPEFRAEVQKRLAAANLKTHFVDSGFYHGLSGEAHCATNVIREKPTK